MPFSEENKPVTDGISRCVKGYGKRRLLAEFPEKNWTLGDLDTLLTKLHKTGSTDRRRGSGRLKCARTEDNVTAVAELVLSQEDKPQTHRSTRQISRETGLSQTSVLRIIYCVFRLKCLKKRRAQELTEANRHARLVRSKMLLKKILAE